MNKKICTILLSILLLSTLFFTFISAEDDYAEFTVVPDRYMVVEDDIIEFSVNMTQTGKISDFEMSISIPSGLTYVQGSLKCLDKSALGWDDLDINENFLFISGYGSTPYAGTETVTIATFKCSVDAPMTKNSFLVSLKDVVCDNENFLPKTKMVIDAKLYPDVTASSISLDTEEKTINDGESFEIKATVAPENASTKNLRWKSSDENVATVVNGVVTGHKPGTAVIKAYFSNGVESEGCSVTVVCAHSSPRTVPAVPSTCIEHGHGEYVICDNCGLILQGDTSELPFSQHQFTEDPKDKYLSSAATCVSAAKYYTSCSVCGEKGTEIFSYGEIDPNNHTGSTHIENKKSSTCYSNGYSGDTICDLCNKLIKKGETSAKKNHTASSEWIFDENYHWHVCTVPECGAIFDRTSHLGGKATCNTKAVCSTCGQEYGTVDPTNHLHTELRNQKEPTEIDTGYSGDLYCLDCEKIVREGVVIAPLSHEHSLIHRPAKEPTEREDGNIEYWYCEGCMRYFADETTTQLLVEDEIKIKYTDIHNFDRLMFDEGYHWYVCSDCGAIYMKSEHSGGEATCTEQAICSLCGQPYGKLAIHDFVKNAAPEYFVRTTSDGHNIYYFSCSKCGAVSSEMFEKLPERQTEQDYTNIILVAIAMLIIILSVIALILIVRIIKRKNNEDEEDENDEQ